MLELAHVGRERPDQLGHRLRIRLPRSTRSCTRRSLAAATIFIACVIWLMFLTTRILRLISRNDAMFSISHRWTQMQVRRHSAANLLYSYFPIRVYPRSSVIN